MERIQLKALGKINLGLDVLGRRENGYHDVRMIMQTVYLYDEVHAGKAGGAWHYRCIQSRFFADG